MGCTLDHSLVGFSTSKRYTECVSLMKKKKKKKFHCALLCRPLRIQMKSVALKYTLERSLKLHAKHYLLCVSLNWN